MTPLLLFLLGCAAAYVGTVTAAFSALMRLSLRIMAEGGPRERIGVYLDDPRRLFVPARLLLGIMPVIATALLARVTGVDHRGIPVLVLSVTGFVLIAEHLVPLLIVRRDPEHVLSVLLPSFDAVAKIMSPLTRALLRVGTSSRTERQARQARQAAAGGQPDTHHEDESDHGNDGEHEPLQEGQARAMLRSLVHFRETMVREVMTPRPDIVAVSADATLSELQALFRDQQYSRMPVYQESLDNVVGLVFVKDLIHQAASSTADAAITPLIRPATFVPETKRVVDLLREFQVGRLQIAVVVDEYGGTAGLVTLEDLIEEIVGEIRDEYDVEVEPVTDEGNGTFVFSGKAHVHELSERLGFSPDGEGFETVGGYLLSRLGRVPTAGERFEIDGLSVEVLEAERRRITRVRIAQMAEPEAPLASNQ
ncbi:MAG: hemolysin family protein [Vicinamibacterales bacterium]